MNRGMVKTLLLCFFSLATQIASADVISSNDEYFELKFERVIPVPVAQLETSLLDIGSWWHPDHTYSGSSSNLKLDTTNAACFCEKLPHGGVVRHMQLAQYRPDTLIRLIGGLGPLQNFPVNGVLDFQLKSLSKDSTELLVTYKVSGKVPTLKQWTKPVNQMIGQQVSRLIERTTKP